ncbi:MAG: SagB/ThcOx family dehydrogenase [Candidatus Bathyarchaeota archaeon]|nr:SagB/ThcOx family dehydrogenase [Candidatus Bathyarchaeota archaeon]MDH5787166.1 SagB/ThcOx family dehydrogenase [Candidatus Bathyarchaeota archaeon]
MEEYRKFLKNYVWEHIIDKKTDTLKTDQYRNVPHPPLQKEYPKEAKLIDLVASEKFAVAKMPFIEVIRKRKSRRKYSKKALTLEELSFLLWATQGVHRIIGNGMATQRVVPSGGARHPFETYLVINRVKGIEPGLYRYLALEHKLYRIPTKGNLARQLVTACMEQKFVGSSAVTFVWTVIPYRAEWRYGKVSHKMIAIDAGHLCQNLYLACEAINAGACAVGAYSQRKMDKLLGVDGKEEFTIYVASIGKTE